MKREDRIKGGRGREGRSSQEKREKEGRGKEKKKWEGEKGLK